MARMRLLDLVRPFGLVLPEVEVPYQKVDQTEKLVFTVAAALLFVLLAEVPVYGLKDRADPIGWLRAGLAMSHGTLAELGVLPIVLSGIYIQILAGLKRISVSLDLRSDRALFQSLQKLSALGIALVFSVLLALANSGLESPRMTLVVAAQLFLGSGTIVYLDEVLSKGYGVVTGTVLFTIVRAAQKFLWSALSVESVAVAGKQGYVTYGALPALFFNLKNRSIKYAFTEFAFRTSAPNLIDILLGLGTFLVTLYVGMVRLNLQVRSTRMRAQSSTFPVRLAYAGAQPVLYALSVIAASLLFSYAMSAILSTTNNKVMNVFLANFFGTWDRETGLPLSGYPLLLVPHLGHSILISLLRIVVYTLVLTGLGAYIGDAWTKSSGFAPQDIAKTFKENSIVLVGKRDVSVVKELRRIIPLAATLGGLLTGLVVAVADLVGTNGWGATMSIAALGVFNIFEQLASEGMVGPEALQNFM